jgi:hypothetical protein
MEPIRATVPLAALTSNFYRLFHSKHTYDKLAIQQQGVMSALHLQAGNTSLWAHFFFWLIARRVEAVPAANRWADCQLGHIIPTLRVHLVAESDEAA